MPLGIGQLGGEVKLDPLGLDRSIDQGPDVIELSQAIVNFKVLAPKAGW
jgi:hypothetical protein